MAKDYDNVIKYGEYSCNYNTTNPYPITYLILSRS